MPDDLREQIAWVHEACEAMGVPILTAEGFEADDVIGTLAIKAAGAGFDVAIVTGDKDFFQLVGGPVKVFNPRDEGTWYDESAVNEKFGVPPAQVVDVLALMGDTIDNVKGVPGIGEKGARDLIRTYGSVEALLAGADEVPQKKYREALKAHADDARQSRELVTIHTTVDVAFDEERFRFRGPSRERCYALFSQLGFRTLVTDYAPTAASVVRDYAVVESLEALATLVAEWAVAPRLALRLITDGTAPVRATLVGITVATAPRQARYIPLGHHGFMGDGSLDRDAALRLLAPVLTDAAVRKVGHDLKADTIVLGRHGIALDGLDLDTMLAAYLLDATRSSQALEPMALEQLGYRAVDEDQVRGKGAKARPFADLPADGILDYAGERADLAFQLADTLGPALERDGLGEVYRDLERPLIPILAGLERVGVRVDIPALAAQASRVDHELGRSAPPSSRPRARPSTSTRPNSWRRFSSRSCSCRC
jgi:DNA polymerase I